MLEARDLALGDFAETLRQSLIPASIQELGSRGVEKVKVLDRRTIARLVSEAAEKAVEERLRDVTERERKRAEAEIDARVARLERDARAEALGLAEALDRLRAEHARLMRALAESEEERAAAGAAYERQLAALVRAPVPAPVEAGARGARKLRRRARTLARERRLLAREGEALRARLEKALEPPPPARSGAARFVGFGADPGPSGDADRLRAERDQALLDRERLRRERDEAHEARDRLAAELREARAREGAGAALAAALAVPRNGHGPGPGPGNGHGHGHGNPAASGHGVEPAVARRLDAILERLSGIESRLDEAAAPSGLAPARRRKGLDPSDARYAEKKSILTKLVQDNVKLRQELMVLGAR